jgi:hypothetical protein
MNLPAFRNKLYVMKASLNSLHKLSSESKPSIIQEMVLKFCTLYLSLLYNERKAYGTITTCLCSCVCACICLCVCVCVRECICTCGYASARVLYSVQGVSISMCGACVCVRTHACMCARQTETLHHNSF